MPGSLPAQGTPGTRKLLMPICDRELCDHVIANHIGHMTAMSGSWHLELKGSGGSQREVVNKMTPVQGSSATLTQASFSSVASPVVTLATSQPASHCWSRSLMGPVMCPKGVGGSQNFQWNYLGDPRSNQKWEQVPILPKKCPRW